MTVEQQEGLQHSTRMLLSRRTRWVCSVAVALAAVSATACDSGESDDEASGADSTAAPPLSVTIPAERLTPFCQAMIELSDRLADDPPDDTAAEIIDVYESLVDVVPPEIESEFLTVLARLQSGTPQTTVAVTTVAPTTTVAGGADVTDPTTPFADEGHLPDDDPAVRVNEYVQFACRDAVNNPGPAATQPGESVAP